MKLLQNTLYLLLIIQLASCTLLDKESSNFIKKIPGEKRKEYLIIISKEAVLKYGKEFYREYGQPKIENYKVAQGENKGREVYTVTFFYDKEKEQMNLEFATKVFIWADSGEPFSIHYGNTMVSPVN